MQCEHSSSSSGFVLFTLGMKRAPDAGTLVGCYGDPASREGHFSEDTEGRATLKYYQVTHIWFSNLIRAFEIPVGLWHRLCVHSQGWLRLGSFSFEIQEKRLQKLVNSALQPGRWWSNPKEQCFEWFGDQRTLCLLQAVQKQQRQGELCPQSIPHMTKQTKCCSAPIPVHRWEKAFCINSPGGNCVTAVCSCLMGKGTALLGMCEVQGHALLRYKSQRLQPPTSHFGRGA